MSECSTHWCDRMGILNEGKDDEDCHIRGRLALISRWRFNKDDAIVAPYPL